MLLLRVRTCRRGRRGGAGRGGGTGRDESELERRGRDAEGEEVVIMGKARGSGGGGGARRKMPTIRAALQKTRNARAAVAMGRRKGSTTVQSKTRAGGAKAKARRARGAVDAWDEGAEERELARSTRKAVAAAFEVAAPTFQGPDEAAHVREMGAKMGDLAGPMLVSLFESARDERASGAAQAAAAAAAAAASTSTSRKRKMPVARSRTATAAAEEEEEEEKPPKARNPYAALASESESETEDGMQTASARKPAALPSWMSQPTFSKEEAEAKKRQRTQAPLIAPATFAFKSKLPPPSGVVDDVEEAFARVLSSTASTSKKTFRFDAGGALVSSGVAGAGAGAGAGVGAGALPHDNDDDNESL